MNIMDKLGIKRLIAIVLVLGYVGFVGYAMASGRTVPDSYITMTGMIISFYFGAGKSQSITDATVVAEVKPDAKEISDNNEAQG